LKTKKEKNTFNHETEELGNIKKKERKSIGNKNQKE
jgi:hypothetical protein